MINWCQNLLSSSPTACYPSSRGRGEFSTGLLVGGPANSTKPQPCSRHKDVHFADYRFAVSKLAWQTRTSHDRVQHCVTVSNWKKKSLLKSSDGPQAVQSRCVITVNFFFPKIDKIPALPYSFCCLVSPVLVWGGSSELLVWKHLPT